MIQSFHQITSYSSDLLKDWCPIVLISLQQAAGEECLSLDTNTNSFVSVDGCCILKNQGAHQAQTNSDFAQEILTGGHALSA